MSELKVLFENSGAVTVCAVEVKKDSRIDVIRDHFLRSKDLNEPLGIQYHRDVENQGWVLIKENPKIVTYLPSGTFQDNGVIKKGVYFKVVVLDHDALQCTCHACKYAYKYRNEVDFNSSCAKVINSIWPPLLITSCVMLIGLAAIGANYIMITDPLFCTGKKGSSCLSQWIFFGSELGLGGVSLCVLIGCAVLKGND